jgi:hypothetical protein
MVKNLSEWIKKYNPDELMLICGLRGAGKTHITEEIIKTKFIPSNINYYIYDLNDEYRDFPPQNVYVPKTTSETEFEEVAKKIWDTGNISFDIDEAENFINVRKPMTESMTAITRRGRHRKIGSIAITRRIAEFSKEFFSLSDWVVLFKMFSPNDIRYVAEFLTKEDADKLSTLKPYHYLVYHEGKTEEYGPEKPWWDIWHTSAVKKMELGKWFEIPEKTIEFGTFLHDSGVLKTDNDIDHYLDNPLEYDTIHKKYVDYLGSEYLEHPVKDDKE